MAIQDKAEFQRWRDHPLTVEFLGVLAKAQSNLTEAWGRGQQLAPEQQAQAVMLGRLSRVQHNDILEMLGVEIEDGEEEQDRPE